MDTGAETESFRALRAFSGGGRHGCRKARPVQRSNHGRNRGRLRVVAHRHLPGGNIYLDGLYPRQIFHGFMDSAGAPVALNIRGK